MGLNIALTCIFLPRCVRPAARETSVTCRCLRTKQTPSSPPPPHSAALWDSHRATHWFCHSSLVPSLSQVVFEKCIKVYWKVNSLQIWLLLVIKQFGQPPKLCRTFRVTFCMVQSPSSHHFISVISSSRRKNTVLLFSAILLSVCWMCWSALFAKTLVKTALQDDNISRYIINQCLKTGNRGSEERC